MTLVKSPTELSTAATDLFLAVEGLVLLLWLRQAPAGNRTDVLLWSWVFGLVFFASLLGAAAHGLELRAASRSILFALIFSSLGIVAPLIAAGALADLWGWGTVKGWAPFLIPLTLALFLAARFLRGAWPFLLVYEGLAYCAALSLYVYLAVSGRRKGADWITAALIIGWIGAWVQSRKITVNLLVPLDQNGVFHLIAMAALAVLARGVRMGM